MIISLYTGYWALGAGWQVVASLDKEISCFINTREMLSTILHCALVFLFFFIFLHVNKSSSQKNVNFCINFKFNYVKNI